MTTRVKLFNKLIVADEEAMAAYYCAVFDLKVAHREAGNSAGAGEQFREVILSSGETMEDGTLTVFKYVNRTRHATSRRCWASSSKILTLFAHGSRSTVASWLVLYVNIPSLPSACNLPKTRKARSTNWSKWCKPDRNRPNGWACGVR